MVAAAAAAAAAVAANGGSRYGYNMADVAAAASTGGSSRYGYNAAAAVAAAAHRESSAAYFSSAAAAASLNPYAAAAYAQNMMSTWNGYSIAAYQGLQREGVTYGMTVSLKLLLHHLFVLTLLYMYFPIINHIGVCIIL